MSEQRETNIDGTLHVEGVCCEERMCRVCGGRTHYQAIYGGFIEICESCPPDADRWEARGTYRTDVEVGGHGVAESSTKGFR